MEDEVKELQKHKAWECGVMSTHDDLPARPGSYAIVRLYDYDKRSKHGKASLWWTLAEILAVVEGDGISPDSLLEVRLFKEYIKHVSNYAVNPCVETKRRGASHAIDATPARQRGGVDSSPFDGCTRHTGWFPHR